jgi:cob(I)alamin adenosyltransferase
MKIYTKTGDDGSTGLFGGDRAKKSDVRFDCYGSIDELNAAIGLAAAGADEMLLTMLRTVQAELFALGSQLIASGADVTRLPALEESSITRLESEIDSAESVLTPLKNFILPGGTETSARLHLARTTCRRAERLLVSFGASPIILRYINRLSDWLFVQARLANHLAGVADVPWMGSQS